MLNAGVLVEGEWLSSTQSPEKVAASGLNDISSWLLSNGRLAGDAGVVCPRPALDARRGVVAPAGVIGGEVGAMEGSSTGSAFTRPSSSVVVERAVAEAVGTLSLPRKRLALPDSPPNIMFEDDVPFLDGISGRGCLSSLLRRLLPYSKNKPSDGAGCTVISQA